MDFVKKDIARKTYNSSKINYTNSGGYSNTSNISYLMLSENNLNNNSNVIYLYDKNINLNVLSGNSINFNSINNNVLFNYFTANSDGSISLKTENNTIKLAVNDKYLKIDNNEINEIPTIQSEINNSPEQLLINPAGGNVLIGTETNSGQKLQVNGSIKSKSLLISDNGYNATLSVNSNNELLVNGEKISIDDFIVDGGTVNGNLTVNGDIIQNGSAYETHAEKVFTTNDQIILRDGAVSGLNTGEYAGFTAKKYDGTNDGQLVFDKDGFARVGDVGSLQKLATIDENVTDNYLLKYDGTNKKLVGVNYAPNSTLFDGISSDKFVYGSNNTKTIYTSFAAMSGKTGSGFYDVSDYNTTWWHIIHHRHVNVDNNYAMQIFGNFYDVNDLKYRIIENGTPSAFKSFAFLNNDATFNNLEVNKLTNNSTQKSYYISIASPSWIRIAKLSTPLTGEAYGTFSINNGYHYNEPAGIIFTISTSYRTVNHHTITQIGGTNERISKARIVYPTNADTDYYIEVYVNSYALNNYTISLSNSYNIDLYSGQTAGSIPVNYSSKELTFVNDGISANNILLDKLSFKNNNNYIISDADGWNFIGGKYMFFNQSAPTYFANTIVSRGNIINDAHEYLIINGGTLNQTYFPYGNVGIGATPTSANRLKISSASSTVDIMSLVGYTNSEFIFSGSWNGSVDYLGLRTAAHSTPDILLDVNGNVGIGNSTNTPRAKLDVNGNIFISGNTLIGNSTDNGYKLQIDGTPEYQMTWKRTSVSKLWGLGSDGSGTYIYNLTDKKLPLYITNTGSVLINTITSNGYIFNVSGTTFLNGDTSVKSLYFKNSNLNLIDGADNIGLFGNGYFYFAHSLGTYFENSIFLRGALRDDQHSYLSIFGGTSGQTYFSGNVGIGTTPSDTYKLKVNGKTLIQNDLDVSNNLYTVGDLTVDGVTYLNSDLNAYSIFCTDLHVDDATKVDNLNADKVDGIHFWTGTKTQYNAITTKDSSTLYIIL